MTNHAIAGGASGYVDATGLTGAAAIDPSAEMLSLFRAHGPALCRFCRSMLGSANDAEDVVQDAFLKLLQHLRAGGDRNNLRAWLFAVAANACRDRVRWRVRWLPWQSELDHRAVDPVDAVDAIDAIDDAPDRKKARAAFRTLATRDRVLLSLRAQGLSYREMASAAGIAEASVGRLLARAVDRWKRGLERT